MGRRGRFEWIGAVSDPWIRLPGGAGNTTRGEGVRRGVGFAVGFKNICYSEGGDDFCTARVVLREDGRFLVVAEGIDPAGIEANHSLALPGVV